jgi:hypothetical protein
LAGDNVQVVKGEMLRAHLVDRLPVTEEAAAHGYCRAAFYPASASFDQSGMGRVLDERRGRRRIGVWSPRWASGAQELSNEHRLSGPDQPSRPTAGEPGSASPSGSQPCSGRRARTVS